MASTDHDHSSDGNSLNTFCVGPWLVEPSCQRISRGAESYHLEPRIMRVLTCLAEHAGDVVPRERLLDDVWGDVVVNEEALTRAVSDLRKVFDDDPTDPRFIETIRGTGYRLIAPVSEPPSKAPVPGGEHSDAAPPRLATDPSFRLHPLFRPALPVLLLIGIAAWFTLGRTSSPPEPALLSTTPLTSFPGYELDPALSPDGNSVAYAGGKDYWTEAFDLYVKQPNAETVLRLTDTPGAERNPAWSPDGTTLAFSQLSDDGAALYTVPAIGGPARKIVDTDAWIHGLDWSPDGRHLVYATHGGGIDAFHLILLALDTRAPTPLTTPPSSSRDHSPAFSPNGRSVAFVRSTLPGAEDLYLAPISGGPPRRLTTLQTRIRGLDWMPDGQHVVFSTLNAGVSSLWRVSVNDGTLARIPTTTRRIDDLSVARSSGVIVFEEASYESDIQQISLNPHANAQTTSPTPQPLIHSTRWDGAPAYAPDGRRLAFVSSRSGHPEIWVADREGQNAFQLTSLEGPPVGPPRWSPNGERIAFTAAHEGTRIPHVIDAAGGLPQRLIDGSATTLVSSWSRDGRWIYAASDRSGDWQIWKIPSSGGQLVQVTAEGGLVAYESPDGQALYYTKPNVDGIWKRSLDGGPERLLIDTLKRWDWNNWTVRLEGIYFLERSSAGAAVARYDFATKTIRRLVSIPNIEDTGFAVSPDGTTLLFTDETLTGSDLVWTEAAN